ncbi:MAG: phosphatase PAP2 family protein [Noviherbaspirillum sp.]
MRNRQFLQGLLILLCAALALVLIGRYTALDLYLADAMFDFAAMRFPWQEHWFYAGFMHHTMKALMMGVALAPAVALLVDRFTSLTLLDKRTRSILLLVTASALLIPLTISLLKAVSIHHCPWSLARYGGFAPYLRLFDSLPPGVPAGHCFPAGHASSGLWLGSAAAFFLPGRPGKAFAAFLIGILPGLALGLGQQMRGAHFLTHTLWSAWIAALLILVLARLLVDASPAAHGAPAAPTRAQGDAAPRLIQ